MKEYTFTPVGYISSCYKEKFGIPRQSGLVKSDKTELHLTTEFSEESVRGLDGFSHLWIQFLFHATRDQGWKQMVRPPRLGGNKKVGVFATRSTFRPNAIGLSAVALSEIEIKNQMVVLHLSGADLLDGTPVLDIKPYLPYADNIPEAVGGFAPHRPSNDKKVVFSKQAFEQCRIAEQRLEQDILPIIEQLLQLDPRPSYQINHQNKTSNNNRVYAMQLFDFDLKWEYCQNSEINVIELDIK